MGSLKDSYNDLLTRYGFWTTLLRRSPSQLDIRVTVRVMRRYAEEQGLIHEVSQNSTWFVVRRTELELADFPLPVQKGDRILDDNAWYTVYVAEPMRDGPNVIGYRCRTIGD